MADFIIAAIKYGLLAFGILFLILAAVFRHTRKKKEAVCTRLIKGTVARIERVSSWDSEGYVSVSWHPVYEYDVDGVHYEKRSNLGNSQQDMHEGEIVDIYVDPENPDEYYCKKDPSGTIVKMFFFMGLLFLVIGIVAFFVSDIVGAQVLFNKTTAEDKAAITQTAWSSPDTESSLESPDIAVVGR